jgi:hypothetical protein
MKKKRYITPEMQEVELHRSATLLSGSQETLDMPDGEIDDEKNVW